MATRCSRRGSHAHRHGASPARHQQLTAHRQRLPPLAEAAIGRSDDLHTRSTRRCSTPGSEAETIRRQPRSREHTTRPSVRWGRWRQAERSIGQGRRLGRTGGAPRPLERWLTIAARPPTAHHRPISGETNATRRRLASFTARARELESRDGHRACSTRQPAIRRRGPSGASGKSRARPSVRSGRWRTLCRGAAVLASSSAATARLLRA